MCANMMLPLCNVNNVTFSVVNWCVSLPSTVEGATYTIDEGGLKAVYECSDGYREVRQEATKQISCASANPQSESWTWSKTDLECTSGKHTFTLAVYLINFLKTGEHNG